MKSLLFAAIILTMFGCDKLKATVEMTYHITECAESWTGDAYFLDKTGTLKSFLEKKDIKVVEISIKTDCAVAQGCKACFCLSCDIATVEVPKADENKMKALNFLPK
jgi:hypothetical protein